MPNNGGDFGCTGARPLLTETWEKTHLKSCPTPYASRDTTEIVVRTKERLDTPDLLGMSQGAKDVHSHNQSRTRE